MIPCEASLSLSCVLILDVHYASLQYVLRHLSFDDNEVTSLLYVTIVHNHEAFLQYVIIVHHLKAFIQFLIIVYAHDTSLIYFILIYLL